MQERRIPTMELMREEILPSNPLKEHQQRKVTMLIKDNNKNGQRNSETRITEKKARRINKNKSKLEKL
jgi:hypothetical protein